MGTWTVDTVGYSIKICWLLKTPGGPKHGFHGRFADITNGGQVMSATQARSWMTGKKERKKG